MEVISQISSTAIYGNNKIVVAGGVAANSRLKSSEQGNSWNPDLFLSRKLRS